MTKTSSQRNILQGYVTNVAFAGLRVPAPMQNLMLRDYAAKNSLIFKLSVGEYAFPGCSLQLFGLLPHLKNLEGIGMCSMFMLPAKAKQRHALYEACIGAGAAIHLILEGVVVRDFATAERVEEILNFNRWLEAAPKTIPNELLPRLSIADSFV